MYAHSTPTAARINRPTAGDPAAHLSARSYALWREGTPTGGRSEALYAVCMELIAQGVTDGDILEVLGRSPLWRHYGARDGIDNRRDPLPRAAADVARMRRKYAAGSRAPRDESERQQAAVWRERARSWQPERIAGQALPASLSRVLLGALAVAERVGRTSDVSLPSREVAEQAGVSHRTASRALGDLVKRGALQRVQASTDETAARYRFMPGHEAYAGARVEREDAAGPAHDAWRWGGLGGSALRVWHAVSAQPRTAKDLAELLGYRRVQSVYPHLRRLIAAGVVVKDDDGYRLAVAPPVPLLDEAARQYRTAGRGERQRAEHARHRDAREEMVKRKEERTRERREQRYEPDPATVPPPGDEDAPDPDMQWVA